MVELALYGLVEVCLFSSLLGFFCRFHREGVFAFLVGAGLEVQESCLFIVVVEFLEYLNSATHIVRNKFKILSNNILTSILPCQKIHLT